MNHPILTGTVYPKMNSLSLFAHFHVVPNPYTVVVFSMEHKRRMLKNLYIYIFYTVTFHSRIVHHSEMTVTEMT